MEASPWLRRSASRCWITSPRRPIRASVPRCCIRCLKSCFGFWLRPSPGRTISLRRRCGEPSIWRSSRRFYRYDSGILSHYTLCDVFAALDPALFKSCFLAWINGLRDDERECPANGGIMPRWLTARSGWHAAEIGGPIQSRAFHCRPRSEPEAGDQHLFGTSASAATCSFAD